jgi:hypothetical protein
MEGLPRLQVRLMIPRCFCFLPLSFTSHRTEPKLFAAAFALKPTQHYHHKHINQSTNQTIKQTYSNHGLLLSPIQSLRLPLSVSVAVSFPAPTQHPSRPTIQVPGGPTAAGHEQFRDSSKFTGGRCSRSLCEARAEPNKLPSSDHHHRHHHYQSYDSSKYCVTTIGTAA